MFPLGKLLGIMAVQRTLSDTTVFHQLLAGAATLILLTVVTAFMFGALIIGGFYAIHLGLINYGLSSDAACVVLIALAVMTTVILVLAVCTQLQKLQNTLRTLLTQQSPVTSRITEVGSAFLDGFLLSSRKPRRKR